MSNCRKPCTLPKYLKTTFEWTFLSSLRPLVLLITYEIWKTELQSSSAASKVCFLDSCGTFTSSCAKTRRPRRYFAIQNSLLLLDQEVWWFSSLTLSTPPSTSLLLLRLLVLVLKCLLLNSVVRYY
jgi:hypothetical protein